MIIMIIVMISSIIVMISSIIVMIIIIVVVVVFGEVTDFTELASRDLGRQR